jgi:hypothetical protein
MLVDRLLDWFEEVFGFLSFFFGFVLLAGGILVAAVGGVMYGLDRPTCYERGEKMAIRVEWGLLTRCMVNIGGQWLPWDEVIPVERNGRIVFEPKPYVRLAPPEQK